MRYNFDILANRRNTDSLKWDVLQNELPMWVADMDFKTFPGVVDVLRARVDIEAYGYSLVNDKWFEAINKWWKYYNLEIKKENLIFVNGVVSAISSLVERVSNIGDNVLLITPTYNIFYNCIINHGRHVMECDLDFKNYEYSLDLNKLEKCLSNPLTTLLILCNPQNPVGRIWTKEELTQIGILAKKYSVTVISDEIHCDITMPGIKYIPFASVSEECKDISITLASPSKTFNIAGLNTAFAAVFNQGLYNICNRSLNSSDIAEPNFFAIEATVAAYTNGRVWVDELRSYVFNNRKIVEEFIEENISFIHVIKSNATYLAWLDCSKITNDSVKLQAFIREKTGLFLSDGVEYHGNGNHFLRMNLATSKENVIDGLNRLKNAVLEYKEFSN